MRLLVDTSVLLRYADLDDPQNELVKTAIEFAFARGHDLGFTPQVAREFWNVMTRPRQANGFGLTPEEVDEIISALEDSFSFWDDVPGISAEWRKLVVGLQVRGVQVHDANHAAAALKHGAEHVLTLDRGDFDRFRWFGVTPVYPENLLKDS